MLFVLLSATQIWAASPQESATAKLQALIQSQKDRKQADTIISLRVQKVSVKKKSKDKCTEKQQVRIQGKPEAVLKGSDSLGAVKSFRLQYTQSIYTCEDPGPLDDTPPQKDELIEAYLQCKGSSKNCTKASRYGAFLSPTKLQSAIRKNLQDSGILDACKDLPALKQTLNNGPLSAQQETCLSYSIKYLSLNQTQRAKRNTLLIEHAKKSKDRKKWTNYLAFHLEKISREDPKLVSSYAIQLFRTKDYKNAMYWARIALENKHRLSSGQEYKKIVSGLYRLRSEASLAVWKNQSEKAEQAKYKQVATEAVQAWLEYLRATQQDTTAAKTHCSKIISAEQCQ